MIHLDQWGNRITEGEHPHWLSLPVLKRTTPFWPFLSGRVWRPNQTIDINHNFRYFLLALITFIHFSPSPTPSPLPCLFSFFYFSSFSLIYIFFLFFFSFLFINFVIFSSCVARQFSIEFSRRVVVVVVALMSLILVNTLRANNGPGSWILGCSFRLVASTPCRLSDLALICGGKIVIIFWRALPPGHSPPSPYSSSHSRSTSSSFHPTPVFLCISIFFASLFFCFTIVFSFVFLSSFFHFVFLSQRPRDDDSFGCLLVVLWYLIRICVAFICMTPPSATSSTSTPFCTQKAYQFTSH